MDANRFLRLWLPFIPEAARDKFQKDVYLLVDDYWNNELIDEAKAWHDAGWR